MSDIYVFSSNEEDNDYSTMGLVGALEPTTVTFRETLNGESVVTMEHPLDEFGAYLHLVEGNILVVPVPVRTTPEIQNGSCVTTVWKYKVKPLAQLTSKNQRTLYKKKTGSGSKKVLNAGDIVTVVQKSENSDERWKVKSDYGEGWINAGADGPDGFDFVSEHIIADNSNAIEEIQSPWTVTPQYFRIQTVKKSMEAYEVEARHISYDLLYNLSIYESEASVKLQTVLDGILNGCICSHEFKAYTNVDNEQAGIFYRLRNPIDAFLNEDDGVCSKYDVCLIRDNYSLYFLHDPGMNRGVRIQYGKNMTGINFESSTDEIVTRIVPIGETKDGQNLYLSDDKKYIDYEDYKAHAENGASLKSYDYPTPHVYELKCDNCKVGDKDEKGGKITEAIARERMTAQAYKMFEDGCCEPKVSMSVEFVNLGDTEEYKDFKDLENCFLADYIIVQHPDLNIDVTARIVEIEWDCILDRMNAVTIGQVGATLANTGITSWQIPSGISGSKIASGTIGGSALKTDIISTIHIQADTISTEILQAACVTAEKIAAGAITADHIQAGTLDAVVIEAVTAKIKTIVAESINTDELAAELARINVLIAGSATFDKATIKHLVAEAMNLEYGVAGQVFIKNLAVEYAQMVGATIGNLCIKASDGNYYTIDVDENGNVSATKTTVSSGEISAGQTSGGRVILETNITAANLNTSNLLATYALINKIDAARIDVAELFAQKAFIDALYTSKIYGGKSIEMIAGQVDTAMATSDVEFYLSESATELKGGSWQTVAPEWVDSRYMWMRVKTSLKDGTESTSNPTCIAGATGPQGTTGPQGVSITAVTEQYYLSSSKTTQTGGQWQTTQPVWSDGKYIWTRVRIDYSDGTSSYTEPYCDATWEVVNEAAIYSGDEPPEAPIAAGKIWIDTGVTPTVIRRWQGVTLDTLDSFFTVTNGSGTSGWTISNNSGDGIDLVPGNIGVNSTTATVTLKAVRDLSSVVISGAYYTETKYDKLTLTVAGTTVLNAVSGTSAAAQRYAGALAQGDEIVLKYVKDSNQSAENEASTLFTITSGGWDTVSDLEEINDISNRLIAQQAEAQKAIDQLATAISIDTSGAHFYKPGYRDRSEVRIDQDSVDIVVGGNVNSSFIAGGLILGNYMLWHPEASGGLAFNLM